MIDVVTEELQIDGMTCESCTSTVQGALSSVPGVSTARVDLTSRRAVVTFDPSLTNGEQLAAAVAKAGYTASGQSNPARLRRQRNLILASLLVLAAACWLVVIRQAAAPQGMGLTMGMTLPLFLLAWAAMMVAMMFPTAAPMMTMFATVAAGQRQRAQPFVPTWVFVSAYLVVWVGFGVLAYAAAAGLGALAMQVPWLTGNAARLGGAILVVGGLYQLSPLLNRCLTKCRSPQSFLLTEWRDGYVGAFVMGLRHGAYCLGCCWLLFVILFPLGLMNIAAMVGLTLLIFAEKSLPFGPVIARVAGAGLVAYGVVVVVTSHGLPGVMT